MKTKVLNQFQSLSSTEITTINGGCGGEDYICPEQQQLQEMLEALQHFIGLL